MSCPRLHKSSVVVGAIVAVMLALIEIPGRVVDGSHGPEPSLVFEHGWPWVYLRRETVEPAATYTTPEGLTLVPSVSWALFEVPWSLPKWGIPWLSSANWRFWQASKESGGLRWNFNSVIMFCDFAVALLVVTVVVVAWEFRRRRRPSVFSFGLTDRFLAVASVSAILNSLVYHEQEFRRERQFLDQVYGTTDVWFEGDYVCIAPRWIGFLTGEQWLPEFAWRVSSVNIERAHRENEVTICEQISQLKYVTKIVLWYAGDGFHFSALRNFERLETLELWGFHTFDEQEFNELTQLTQLQKIVIDDMDDLGRNVLSHLQEKLPRCRIAGVHDEW